MNDSLRPETPSGCRAEARRLLDHLRGRDEERARTAATRFLRLRSLSSLGVDGLLAARARLRLKHALAVLAEERGFASWPELKHALEASELASSAPGFHTRRHESLLNRWFTDHAGARASREELGGFLLPYGDQFFVTEAEGIRELGLDPDDPDWIAVGFDLARPRDAAAFARLCERRRAAIARGIGVPSEARRSP